MSNLFLALKGRDNERLLKCRESADLIIDALRAKGVVAEIFGSTLRGHANAESDVDILVLDRNGMTRGQILVLAESVSHITVDVHFGEDFKVSILEEIKEKMRGYSIDRNARKNG